MKGSDIFPSKYLKADDLQNRDVPVVISNVEMENLGDDNKLILHFKGKEKGMVCNRTHFDRIAFLYGDETDDWANRPITLTTEFTQFQGKTMKALRVKPPSGALAPKIEMRAVHQSENPADLNDEEPF